jgi:hypothetical protein
MPGPSFINVIADVSIGRFLQQGYRTGDWRVDHGDTIGISFDCIAVASQRSMPLASVDTVSNRRSVVQRSEILARDIRNFHVAGGDDSITCLYSSLPNSGYVDGSAMKVDATRCQLKNRESSSAA